jgi:hypothetical protein
VQSADSLRLGRAAEAKMPAADGADYFSADETDVKVVLSLVPTPFTTVMMTTAMPAAISPYSIAVAPDSSPKNFNTRCFTTSPKSLSRPQVFEPRIYNSRIASSFLTVTYAMDIATQ